MAEDADSTFGRYLGRLVLEPLPDGRLMRLVEPFGFCDGDQKHWLVPVGAKIDGASIPQPLWSFVGGPFEGKYRNASVIHDYYCDVRSEPWRAVHRVFYAAMRVSGVAEQRAKLLYAAVYFAGPRWPDTVVDNVNLPRSGTSKKLHFIRTTPFERGVLDAVDVAGRSANTILMSDPPAWPDEGETHLNLGLMETLIEAQGPTLPEIDKALDSAVYIVDPPLDSIDPKRVVVRGYEGPYDSDGNPMNL